MLSNISKKINSQFIMLQPNAVRVAKFLLLLKLSFILSIALKCVMIKYLNHTILIFKEKQRFPLENFTHCGEYFIFLTRYIF